MIASALLFVLASAEPATPLQIRVDGEGYLRFARDGRAVYAPEASLVIRNGQLVHEQGFGFLPPIAVPDRASVTIELDGTVRANGQSVGRLVLALSDGMTKRDDFWATPDRPRLMNPGEETAGVIRMVGQEPVRIETPAVTVRTPDPDPEPELKPEEIEISETSAQREVAPAPAAKPVIRPGQAPAPSEEFLRQGGVMIVLNEFTEVTGENFTLGEVATVYANSAVATRLMQLSIGPSPVVGVSRFLDRSLITSRVRSLVAAPAEIRVAGPLRGEVKRFGQQVTAEQFLRAAVTAAEAQMGPGPWSAAQNPQEMAAPGGALTLVAEAVTQSGRQVSVRLAVMVDGVRVNVRTVTLKSDAPPVTVRPGQKVTVRMRRGTLVVEVSATVRAVNAASGEVTVLTETGATLTGRVSADGHIEVKI